MLEQTLRDALHAHAPLMAVLGNNPQRLDLVDVAMGTPAPYLTFNLTETQRAAGRLGLCNPAALGLLRSVVLFTPWAGDIPAVHQINTLVRAALAASSIKAHFTGFGAWAREPETNLLTRGQLFAVEHTE